MFITFLLLNVIELILKRKNNVHNTGLRYNCISHVSLMVAAKREVMNLASSIQLWLRERCGRESSLPFNYLQEGVIELLCNQNYIGAKSNNVIEQREGFIKVKK